MLFPVLPGLGLALNSVKWRDLVKRVSDPRIHDLTKYLLLLHQLCISTLFICRLMAALRGATGV